MIMGTREMILNKAFCLFLDKGFSDVSINDIMQSAGITKGGFYYHFHSREELIFEVIQIYICPFFKIPLVHMREKLENVDVPLCTEDKLRFYYETVHKFVISEEFLNMFEKKDIRNFYFLIFEGIKKYEYLAQISLEAYEERVGLFEEILESGKKEGFFPSNIDAHKWAVTINALKDGFFSLRMLNDNLDFNQKCSISFKQLLNEIIA